MNVKSDKSTLDIRVKKEKSYLCVSFYLITDNMKLLTQLFGFDPKKHSVKTEVFAGITTFLTMAYILAVNPEILSATGMDKEALFTSTTLATILATLIMAVWAKLPFAQAPGMGLNAFFAYTICLGMGYPWQFALAAVFIEGLLFILLTVSNLRTLIVNSIPESLKYATTAGIGLFIAFIGFQNSGIVTSHPTTMLALGDVTSGAPLLALLGMFITLVLLVHKVRGGLLWGILLTTLVGIPMGITSFHGIVNLPPSIAPIFCQLDFSNVWTTDMVIVVCTLLFMDLFDTIGTLIGVSTQAGMMRNGQVPRIKQAFMADAIGTTAGALLGTSTIVTFLESASGVNEGGRTGLTAFTTAMCMALALFFSPLFLSIPAAATSAVLVIVGMMMMGAVAKIPLNDYTEALPAFLCMVLMPFAYSIADGIIIGFISYVVINLLCGKYKKISVPMYVLAVLFCFKFLL